MTGKNIDLMGQTIEEVEALVREVKDWQRSFVQHPFYDPKPGEDEGAMVPMICVWTEGRQYIGGFLGRLPSESIILAHPLLISEGVVPVQGGGYRVDISLNAASFTFGLMEEIEVSNGAVYWMRKDRIQDQRVVDQYEEAHQSLRAEASGIKTPKSSLII